MGSTGGKREKEISHENMPPASDTTLATNAWFDAGWWRNSTPTDPSVQPLTCSMFHSRLTLLGPVFIAVVRGTYMSGFHLEGFVRGGGSSVVTTKGERDRMKSRCGFILNLNIWGRGLSWKVRGEAFPLLSPPSQVDETLIVLLSNRWSWVPCSLEVAVFKLTRTCFIVASN